MELEVYEQGRAAGTLTITREGLYHRIEAVCRPRQTCILRLYVWNGAQCRCLGVLCPEDGAFTLRKRRSAAELPFSPQTAVLGREDKGFLPWRGELDGAQIPHGYRKSDPGGELYAIPWQEDGDFPLPQRIRRAAQGRVCEESCILLRPETEEDTEETPEEAKETAAPPDSAEAVLQTQEDAPELSEQATRFHPEL